MARFINADEFAMSLISCEGLGRKSYEAVLKAIKDYPAVEMECNSDLISRSALIKKLQEKSVKDEVNTLSTTYTYKELAYIICNLPTAYDVEKVVSELEEERNFHRKKKIENERKGWEKSSEHNLFKELCYENAIDIVRKGGVE